MLVFYDKKYNFFEYFNEDNGFLLRSNILKDNIETGELPFVRSFPELLDIGIMGHCNCKIEKYCKSCGIDCYQNATNNKKTNMCINNYRKIIDQSKGAVFQVALGGAGDPNKYEHFEEILAITRAANIVPNMTTSGFQITKNEIKSISKHCGAVAVSYYSYLTSNGLESNPATIEAIEKLIKAGCKTNIHFVLHRNNIVEAYYRVKNDIFPKGINAIIFLLYKPVGLGKKEKMLSAKDEEYINLLSTLHDNKHSYKLGFDTCQSPALYKFCDFISTESLEFCEAGRFSMYIDSELKAYPCSFGIDNPEVMVDLKLHTIKEAWESEIFERFRTYSNINCLNCSNKYCRNCPLDIGINVCGELKVE